MILMILFVSWLVIGEIQVNNFFSYETLLLNILLLIMFSIFFLLAVFLLDVFIQIVTKAYTTKQQGAWFIKIMTTFALIVLVGELIPIIKAIFSS